MKEQGTVYNLLGGIFFLLFFFLLMTAIPQAHHAHHALHSRQEICAAASITKAADIETIRIPAFQTRWLSVIDKLQLRLLNTATNLCAFNASAVQEFITLERIQLQIKPQRVYTLYFLLFPDDPGEYPPVS
jgi:hypothetical protein